MEFLTHLAMILVYTAFIGMLAYCIWRGWDVDYRPQKPDEDEDGGWRNGRPIIPKDGSGPHYGRHVEEPVYVEAVAKKLIESAHPTVKA